MQVDSVVFLVLICSVLLPVSKPKWPIKYESFRVYLRLQKSRTCQAWGGGLRANVSNGIRLESRRQAGKMTETLLRPADCTVCATELMGKWEGQVMARSGI